MKILVVDDEPSIRDICKRVLASGGDEVAVAGSAEEAAAHLGRGWDIVITDITMPGAGGFEVLRRVKETGSADVLMMTAHAELDFAIQALKLGAYDFILKPFSPDVLQAAVKRCLDKRALSVELARERELRAELVRMQKIKDAFGLFVTPEVASYVLGLPEDRRGKGVNKRVTVLFTDVRKFTPFAAHASPEVLVEALNEVFSGIISAIQQEGGIVNKFTGDGVLALFGAPLDLHNHERAAGRAALEVMRFVAELAQERRSRGQHALQIGIGINTGDVVAGCLGSQERTEYSVIGHAVNVAARLNGAAKPGQILLGPGTAKALAGDFECQAVGPMKLDGIDERMAVCELLGPKRSNDDANSGR